MGVPISPSIINASNHEQYFEEARETIAACLFMNHQTSREWIHWAMKGLSAQSNQSTLLDIHRRVHLLEQGVHVAHAIQGPSITDELPLLIEGWLSGYGLAHTIKSYAEQQAPSCMLSSRAGIVREIAFQFTTQILYSKHENQDLIVSRLIEWIRPIFKDCGQYAFLAGVQWVLGSYEAFTQANQRLPLQEDELQKVLALINEVLKLLPIKQRQFTQEEFDVIIESSQPYAQAFSKSVV